MLGVERVLTIMQKFNFRIWVVWEYLDIAQQSDWFGVGAVDKSG